MKLKEFVIFRHATKQSWTHDPDLSEDGCQQALSILEKVRTKRLPQPDLLITSPKKRAQQTLLPVHNELNIPILEDFLLDERNHSETGLDFESRVKKYLQVDLFNYDAEILFLCTHLDWLEVFGWSAPLNLDITGEILHAPPASFYHITLDDDQDNFWRVFNKGSNP